MTDRTLGIIYSLKNGINSADYKIAKYMAKECNYKASMYSRGEIDKILRTAIIDYIQTCDNPIKEIKRILAYGMKFGIKMNTMLQFHFYLLHKCVIMASM